MATTPSKTAGAYLVGGQVSQPAKERAASPQQPPLQSPSVTPVLPEVKSPSAFKVDLEAIVREWATGLLPQNAPPPAQKGSLAWVREEKVEELIKQLRAAGAC